MFLGRLWFLVIPASLATVMLPLQRVATADEKQGNSHPAVHQARSTGGMVVSASPPASQIGRDVLARGGNAADAAVAVGFALAVTWPEAGNIGGGGFMMIYGPETAPLCVDYRECAPASARAKMFERGESTYTRKAVGVPGTVAGLGLVHVRFGKLPWKDVIEPAVQLARDGFEVDEHLAKSLNDVLGKSEVQQNETYSELRRVYGKPDHTPWKSGDRLVLPDLSRTLARIAAGGPREFYHGETAALIVAEMQRGNGLITHRDLAEYEALIRTPIQTTYRGFDIYGPPPPSSGGVCLALMLNMLETFDLRQQAFDSPRTLHLMTETMRRAYCDRARYLGDPAFTAIPSNLTQKSYAEELARAIDLEHASSSASLAPEIQVLNDSPSTTHFSVVDRNGMAVSNTYTLEQSFGARIVVREAGFLLNNEMGDFNWIPGETDRNGRIGTAANIIGPRKRMLSSQTPVIVARDGKAVLVTGTPGGRTIINSILAIIVRTLEFDQDLTEAVAAPRLHHQWFPDRLYAERGTDQWMAAIRRLGEMGHEVVIRDDFQGSAHSIWIDDQTGERHGVADWRRGGFAAGE